MKKKISSVIFTLAMLLTAVMSAVPASALADEKTTANDTPADKSDNSFSDQFDTETFSVSAIDEIFFNHSSENWSTADDFMKADDIAPSFDANSGNKKIIEVTNILQYPELPTGCESVALTILLNHMGYQVDKTIIAGNYLPKMGFYRKDGILYGADFRTTFAGDPKSEYSYGCYAPCIITTANRYFEKNEIKSKAYDITGTSFDTLLSDYIDNDTPVLIWITSSNLHQPYYTDVWRTPEGKTVQWLAYEHCVVLTGYDMDNKLIYVSDPLVGNTSYDYDRIKQRYIDLGQQSVYIKDERKLLTYGDLDDNGKVTSEDSLLVLRQSVGLEQFDDDHRILADIDADERITSADALEILRYSVSLPSKTLIGEIYKEL